VAKKVGFWWALLVGWVLALLPAPHDDGTDNRARVVRPEHEPDSESELPAGAPVQPQGKEIAPVQPPPNVGRMPTWGGPGIEPMGGLVSRF
jgi:hypothetical protein